MDIEAVREYALSLHPEVTEELFAEEWISIPPNQTLHVF